jgi:type I restriction enzyme S subunit
MAMYGATVGRLGVLSRAAATNQAICAIQPSEALDRDFLFYTLLEARSDLIETSFGGAQPNISQDVIREIRIALPDLPTQRRIAARLREQMAGVDAARKAVGEQRNSVTPLFERILSEAFFGITPLSLGINANPAPPGWEWRRLMDVAKLESGHTPSRRHPEYWENGDIPWLALPDIRALDCRIALETAERTNALGIANSSARLLPANTVALSRTASVGFVTVFGCPMATSQDFVNWVCDSGIEPKFLMWLLRASRGFIREVSTGAIHKTVYMDVVERFHVCLPKTSEQAAIAARLDEASNHIESLRAGLNQQTEAVSALPAAYLRASFGGDE